MSTFPEMVAAGIMQLVRQNELAAFEAILKLVRENNALKKELSKLKKGGK